MPCVECSNRSTFFRDQGLVSVAFWGVRNDEQIFADWIVSGGFSVCRVLQIWRRFLCGMDLENAKNVGFFRTCLGFLMVGTITGTQFVGCLDRGTDSCWSGCFL